MLRRTHIEMEHRILYPLFLQPLHSQPLKQILTTREITMQSRSKQRLTKTARTAQKHIFRKMSHAINVFRLIDIKVILLTNFRKSLYPYGI